MSGDGGEVLPVRNDKVRTRRRRLRWTLLACGLFACWWGLGLFGAYLATAPRPRTMPTPPAIGSSIAAVSCRAASSAGDGEVSLQAWLARPAGNGTTAVVLAAGIGGNRLAMLGRARAYLARGIATLLVDLRGTGESTPERIAMGWHEALDLAAWYAFLHARGYATIGAHGVSLGAAATVFSAVRPAIAPPWDFLVLEACYANVREALAARVTPLPLVAFLPLEVCTEWLVGIDADALDAVQVLAHHHCPTLLVCGDADTWVGPDATQRLFDASAAKIRRRCMVPGAGHTDLWRHSPATVRAALRSFLDDVGV